MLQEHEEREFTTSFSYVRSPKISLKHSWGDCLHGVMDKALGCRIVVSEFKLLLRYNAHFWMNTLGKGMNPLILPAMG